MVFVTGLNGTPFIHLSFSYGSLSSSGFASLGPQHMHVRVPCVYEGHQNNILFVTDTFLLDSIAHIVIIQGVIYELQLHKGVKHWVPFNCKLMLCALVCVSRCR